MEVTIIDNTPARLAKLKTFLQAKEITVVQYFEVDDNLTNNGSKLFLIHKSNDNIVSFVQKVQAEKYILFFSGAGIANDIDGINYTDKMFNLPDVFNVGNEEKALNRVEQIVNILKEDKTANSITAIKEVLGFDEAIETPLKKLATSLPFDYVYNNDNDLRNAKSELEKAINKRLNK